MQYHTLALLGAAFLTIALPCVALAQTVATPPLDIKEAGKHLYIPPQVWMVPDGNDYTDANSQYSFQHHVESDDIALFWAKSYGDDPTHAPDPKQSFDPKEALKECDRFYDYYINKLKFVDAGDSVTDKYKTLIYVFDGDDGTAYGGGLDDKIGVLWTPAARIHSKPYGALAHELGHSFQYLVHANGAWAFTSAPEGSKGQPIFEMTSQYMLWQVYPQWMTFENYHLVAFLKQTHLAFGHEENQYHSPYVLEYWSNKRGLDFVGKIWRGAIKGEDAVMTYKRLTGLNQSQFNDEMFDAARHFITWDMKRIEDVAAPYANLQTVALDPIGDNWYRIAPDRCPQNYGYNGIKLQVPSAGTRVTLQFKGIAGAPGFRAINAEKAGWRYGFLAVKSDGSRVYGDTHSASEGTAQFTVPTGTQFLWLVVSGAPTQHWEHIVDFNTENDEQWPYQIKLSGTALDATDIEIKTEAKVK